MGRRVAGVLVVLAVALCATDAQARTITVDAAGGAEFTTINAAIAAAHPGDVVAIAPGAYREHPEISVADLTLQGTGPGVGIDSPSSPAVAVHAAGVTLRGLTISGALVGFGVGGPGTSATLEDVFVTANDTGVSVDGADLRVVRSRLFATDVGGTALRVRNSVDEGHRTTLASSVLGGGRIGTGLAAATAPVIAGLETSGPLTVDLVHSTVTPAPAAVTTSTLPFSGAITVTASRSIVHGTTAPGVVLDRTDTTTSDAATFVDAPAHDFRLRADAPGLDAGGPVGPGESATDLLGNPRVAGAASDLGATEVINTPPTAALAVSGDATRQHLPVTFAASGSADPDPGGRIVRYDWDFGDGTQASTTTAKVDHAYDAVGRYAATVRVADTVGATAAAGPVAVTVRDGVAPALRITSPAPGARLHRLRTVRRHGHRRRVINVLRFGGRVGDAGGVASVDVVLRRTTPRGGKDCRSLDATARRVVASPCALPPVMHATLKGGAWSWHTPAALKMPGGTWELTVSATDHSGNLSSVVLHFTVT